MVKSKKKLFITILFFSVGLFFCPVIVNAENYSSDFITISDAFYLNDKQDLSMSKVHFYEKTSVTGETTSYGFLSGKMINLTDYVLNVHIVIDYYDENYNIVASSTKTEKPGKISANYMMNVILYDNDFIGEATIDDVKYYKINYYTGFRRMI